MNYNKTQLFSFYILILVFIIGCVEQQEQFKQTEISISNKNDTENEISMKLTSPAFTHNSQIPSEFTCDGADSSPPLTINDVPKNTKSLALIMDDPDAPVGVWDHWTAFNIPQSTTQIAKGTEPRGIAGKNSWGRTGYGGPCPPSGTHRYFFKLYALDTELNLPQGSTKKDLERAMQGRIIAQAQLIGTYKRRQ